MKGLRRVGRVLGAVFIVLALLALGAEVVESLNAGGYRSLALGELWYGLDPGSLNFAQAVIQRYLWPGLWDPVIVTVLLWPGWPTLAVIGAIFWFLTRRGGRRRRSFRRGGLN